MLEKAKEAVSFPFFSLAFYVLAPITNSVSNVGLQCVRPVTRLVFFFSDVYARDCVSQANTGVQTPTNLVLKTTSCGLKMHSDSFSSPLNSARSSTCCRDETACV